MDTIVTCKSWHGNLYTFNRDKKFIFLTHPLMIEYLNNKEASISEEDTLFYSKKVDYLKRHGCLDTKEKFVDGNITKELIINEICNLKQLVFEVTDSCNLQCKYCGYGDLYTNYDIREKKMMNPSLAKKFLDYLIDIWNSSEKNSHNKIVHISFYGGEPLLNMPFIKNVVEHIKQTYIRNVQFKFSMTTNATLLAKNIDFLEKNSFSLLLSLDGNEFNNGYRVFPNAINSFNKVLENIDIVKNKYPIYFDENINFNAVLHDRNSVKEIYDFIYNRYNKIPRFSELNKNGLNANTKGQFNKMYHSEQSDYQKHSTDSEMNTLEEKLFTSSPFYSSATKFLYSQNKYYYDSYKDFFKNESPKHYFPSATCIPFSRKIFITVNGKILPCERIGQEFSYGKISDDNVSLDIDYIIEKHNKYLNKLKKLCSNCARIGFCSQCLFLIENINQEKITCPGFANTSDIGKYLGENMSFFEMHPKAYSRIINEVIFE